MKARALTTLCLVACLTIGLVTASSKENFITSFTPTKDNLYVDVPWENVSMWQKYNLPDTNKLKDEQIGEIVNLFLDKPHNEQVYQEIAEWWRSSQSTTNSPSKSNNNSPPRSNTNVPMSGYIPSFCTATQNTPIFLDFFPPISNMPSSSSSNKPFSSSSNLPFSSNIQLFQDGLYGSSSTTSGNNNNFSFKCSMEKKKEKEEKGKSPQRESNKGPDVEQTLSQLHPDVQVDLQMRVIYGEHKNLKEAMKKYLKENPEALQHAQQELQGHPEYFEPSFCHSSSSTSSNVHSTQQRQQQHQQIESSAPDETLFKFVEKERSKGPEYWMQRLEACHGEGFDQEAAMVWLKPGRKEAYQQELNGEYCDFGMVTEFFLEGQGNCERFYVALLKNLHTGWSQESLNAPWLEDHPKEGQLSIGPNISSSSSQSGNKPIKKPKKKRTPTGLPPRSNNNSPHSSSSSNDNK